MNERDDNRGQKKEKWEYKFASWLGERRDGKLIPHAVATSVERTFTRFTRSADQQIVSETVTEIIYDHGGYLPHMEGEKQSRKSFFHQGARVWRE